MGESLNQPSRVKEDGLMGCKLLLQGNKKEDASYIAWTLRISIG